MKAKIYYQDLIVKKLIHKVQYMLKRKRKKKMNTNKNKKNKKRQKKFNRKKLRKNP